MQRFDAVAFDCEGGLQVRLLFSLLSRRRGGSRSRGSNVRGATPGHRSPAFLFAHSPLSGVAGRRESCYLGRMPGGPSSGDWLVRLAILMELLAVRFWMQHKLNCRLPRSSCVLARWYDSPLLSGTESKPQSVHYRSGLKCPTLGEDIHCRLGSTASTTTEITYLPEMSSLVAVASEAPVSGVFAV